MCARSTLRVKGSCASPAKDSGRAPGHTLCMASTGPTPTFIRQWRKHKKLTLEDLAARVGMTHGNLSRIERGLLPYSQRQLEDLARELGTDPASLLSRDPRDPEGIWTVWDRIPPKERKRAIRVLKEFSDPDAGG